LDFGGPGGTPILDLALIQNPKSKIQNPKSVRREQPVNHIDFLGFILQQATGGISRDAVKVLGAGLAIGLGGIGPGIGLGIGTWGATQAIGRNPDAAGDIRAAMILGLGFAEAVAIYALVVALVLIFV
jgi:F-type H+-transporting ATPase subunit c